MTGANARVRLRCKLWDALAVGANCTIHGHFAADEAWRIDGGDHDHGQRDHVSADRGVDRDGTAPAAPVTLSASSLVFPATAVGTASGSQTVTMTNTGTAALTISSIAVTGAEASWFVFGNSCGTSLAVGAGLHDPWALCACGYRAGTAAVTITDSAAGSPQTIALSGTGQ